MPDERDRVPSPEATGGAGPTFEARAGGIALARLLRGDRAAGLYGPPTRVRFQQRVEGAVLDDVVLEGVDALGRTQWVEYQVKRTIEVVPSDRGFADIVARCLGELASDDGSIANGRRRFGLLSRPNNHLQQLERIVRYARAHDNPHTFLNVLRSTASRDIRDRLDHIRAAVATALPEGSADVSVDDALWWFCRVLHVWKLDAEPDTDEVRGVIDRLADLVREPTDPLTVFDELVVAAAEWAPTAASVDLNMVRARLEDRGVALDAAPRQRASFEALVASSDLLLDPQLARIGHRLHLPRWAIRRDIDLAIGDSRMLLLAGRAGVGKSVLARLVSHDLRAGDASVLAVNLAGRTGPLSALEQDLGGSLANAMAGAPIGGTRLLLIDGVEQALTDAGALLASILGAVPLESDNVPPWCLMLTARDESIPTIRRLIEDRGGSPPVVLRIGELTDDEVSEVVAEFPQLAAVDRNARSRALLLRRPYIVELLVRAVTIADLPPDVVGEEHVIDIVDKRLVRLDDGGLRGRGTPYARADIYRALGTAVISAAAPALLDETDSEARAGLASDDLITETRSRWRFAHDVLADYSAASVLLEADGPDRLRTAPAIRRLLRSARLKMQCELADGLKAGRLEEVWTKLRNEANSLAEFDGPRWRDVPWEALLHIGDAREALSKLAVALLDDEGADLGELMVATERQARRAGVEEVEGVVPLDPHLSGPVVDFLVAHASVVPSRWTALAPKLVHEHLDAAASVGLSPGTGLERWQDVPDAVILWADDDQYGDRLEHAIGAISLCGPHLMDGHTDFLVGHACRRPNEIEEPVESPRATAHLAGSNPDLLLRLAGLYYLGRGLRLTGEDAEVGDEPSSRRSFGFDEDREGVRDHSHKFRRHLAMWPLGNNQSNPALGPFTSLLDASSAHALRLIGEVVDTATAARSRLEAGFDRRSDPPDDELVLELNATGWAEPRRFVGPATVWLWFRRTGVGPDPALSALMALRAWGVARLRAGDAVREVRDEILAAGRSLAFVAVALSSLVDAIDSVVDELDPFLPHPLIWHLEIARSTHEHGGTALDVPDANHLSWNMSSVAVLLVLRANTERRQHLRELGEQLVASYAELSGSDAELVARRWGAELDVHRFVAEPRDEGIEISVSYPAGVLEALQKTGGAAVALSMRLTNVMFAAVQARDGKADLAMAVEVWSGAVAGCDERAAAGDEYGVYNTGDILSAAGSALLLAAAAGHEVPDAELRRAVSLLMEGATFFAQSAPLPLGDLPEATEEDEDRVPFRVPDMAWDMGADRSIATALPVLVMRADLRTRAQVTMGDLEVALVALASSPFDETRARLVNSLLPCLDNSCADAIDAHRISVAVARRLVATQGLARRSGANGYGYRPVLLSEPLEATIDAASDILFDNGSSSFAVWLLAACKGDCEHEADARRLLDALVEYDRRVWPAHFARHRYHRSGMWRRAIDVVVADQILDGDDSALDEHLTAFAYVADELTGFLEALPQRADTDAKVERLHDVWPRILDRLLPEFRDIRTVGRNRDGEPYHRDVEDLDRSLLLMIPDDASWPAERSFELGARWLVAYQGVPHVADRAIFYVGRTMGLRNEVAVQVILRTMGHDARTILRESRYALAWLQAVLTDPPEGDGVRSARALLDRMAATGDEDAIRAQQALEA